MPSGSTDRRGGIYSPGQKKYSSMEGKKALTDIKFSGRFSANQPATLHVSVPRAPCRNGREMECGNGAHGRRRQAPFCVLHCSSTLFLWYGMATVPYASGCCSVPKAKRLSRFSLEDDWILCKRHLDEDRYVDIDQI